MRPQPEDTTVKLPVTFDYHGGRSDNLKGNILFTLVLLALSIGFTVIVVRGNTAVGKKILLIAIAWIIVSLFLRFKIMHEQMYSDAYESLKEIDFVPNTDSFWTIYEVDSEYPYIHHFKDGKQGIFVRLEKDVVVGKEDEVLYRHFEAISDAYNLAANSNINMCQIDYMDNVGNDVRLQSMYERLNDCENPDMKEALLSMYANLQDEMSLAYACFDVYLFTCAGKNDNFWTNVNNIVDKFLGGNYISYKVLDIEGSRATCMALMNLKQFSAIEACEHMVATQKYRGIIPISVLHEDGTETKLNKTQEELRQEAAERARREEEAKRNKHKKGHHTKSALNSQNNQSKDRASLKDNKSVSDGQTGSTAMDAVKSNSDKVSSNSDFNSEQSNTDVKKLKPLVKTQNQASPSDGNDDDLDLFS